MATGPRLISLLTLVLLAAVLVPGTPAWAVTTYVVNSAADDTDGGGCEAAPGDCTLREAILAANASPGLDKINFALGSGVPTIDVTTQLPQITDRINISGNTGGAQRVEISGPGGANVLDGLILSNANDSLIRRLVINGFGHRALLVFNSADVNVSGTWIGTDETGLAAAGAPAQFGLVLLSSVDVQIGGEQEASRNVISGNDIGIDISGGSGHIIVNTFVGTTRTGTGDLGNSGEGVSVFESDGILFAFNVIAGNGGDGIRFLNGSEGSDVVLTRVGVDFEGAPLGNDGDGIVVAGTATGTTMILNSIDHNGGLGIDLGDDGVTPNDNADADPGPNELINFPVITRASTTESGTTVNGRLRTTPNTDVTLELYASPSCDPSGHGEGNDVVYVTTVSTDAAGRATFSALANQTVPQGWVVTGTVTNQTSGSTSEFSACEIVI